MGGPWHFITGWHSPGEATKRSRLGVLCTGGRARAVEQTHAEEQRTKLGLVQWGELFSAGAFARAFPIDNTSLSQCLNCQMKKVGVPPWYVVSVHFISSEHQKSHLVTMYDSWLAKECVCVSVCILFYTHCSLILFLSLSLSLYLPAWAAMQVFWPFTGMGQLRELKWLN